MSIDFYRDTIRKAKKEHSCECCGTKIQPGETYHDKAGKSEFGIWWTKECEACQPIINEFMCESGEESYCGEEMRDWWKDERCRICINRWPDCIPEVSFGEPKTDCTEWLDGKCTAGDYCDDITHYCRCENFKNKFKKVEVHDEADII